MANDFGFSRGVPAVLPDAMFVDAEDDMDILTDIALGVVSDYTRDAADGDTSAEYVEHRQLSRLSRKALATLPARRADVIRRRFGFDCDEATQAVAANEFGCSSPRIHQIERAALRSVRWRLLDDWNVAMNERGGR